MMGGMGMRRDQDLVSTLRMMFNEAREARRGKVAKWYRNYTVCNKTPWTHRAEWQPRPSLPQIRPILETRTAWILETEPTFAVAPVSDPNSPWFDIHQRLANDMSVVLKASWDMQCSTVELAKAIWDVQVYGTGVLAEEYNPRLYDGLGDRVTRRVDPFCIYPDPDATSFDDAGYIFEVQRLSHAEIERRFPGALDFIGDNFDEDRLPDENPLDREVSSRSVEHNPRTHGTADNDPRVTWAAAESTSTRNYASHTQHSLVYIAWLREVGKPTTPGLDAGVMGMEPEVGPNGEPPLNEDGTPAEPLPEHELSVKENPMTAPARKDLAVDQWRCVVFLGADVILMDELAIDINPLGIPPYERIVEVETGEFWGDSMVDLLGPAQVELNKLFASILHNIHLMGNPVLKEGSGAGLSRATLTNRPGTRMKVAHVNQVEWMNPPVLQGNLATEAVKLLIQEMERASGLSGMQRGATPTGRNAATVLDSLQEAAFVRIRMFVRNIEWAVQRLANRGAAYIAEFYDAPRLLSIIGPDGTETAKALAAEHFYAPTDDGRAPLRFRVRAEAGSGVATSPMARQNLGKELFALGAIDAESLLSVVNWPNYQAIVARMREMATSIAEPTGPGVRQAARA